jgi:hypothetical protein
LEAGKVFEAAPDPLRRLSDLLGRSGNSLEPARARPADARVTKVAREWGGR